MDYSAIFNVKEEYIFVFSGTGKDEMLHDSVEVFDVQQEIWRLFENVCDKRSKFAAVTFFTGGMKNQKMTDIMHLIGGQDDSANSLKAVGEFNFKDMKTFEADWKLKQNLDSFASCQSSNQVFIAGGNHQDKQQKGVLQIFCSKVGGKDKITKLGSVPGTDLHYFQKQLPNMVTEREDFSLVLDQQQKQFSLLAIGGYNSKGILNSIEKYDSTLRKWKTVKDKFIGGSNGIRSH